MKKYGLIIDGKEVDALDGKTFITVNPATGEEIAEVAEAGKVDIDRAAEWSGRHFSRNSACLISRGSSTRSKAATR